MGHNFVTCASEVVDCEVFHFSILLCVRI